ncbi:MAG: sulfatase [Planctomycetes bacterium]|nr:sulfatase [Planctomycetota bacterium]
MNRQVALPGFAIVLAFLTVPGAGEAVGSDAPRTERPLPNFIVLFADDMGYGDLGCYGNPVIRTPHLDRMAAEGTRFTSFYSAAPVCTPSRVGLLTGRYPTRAGQPHNTGPDTVGGLPLSEILLPQVLQRRGYRTMAIGKWHLGYQPREYLPISRGFDEWFGLPYSNDMIPPWVMTDVPLRLYRNGDAVEEAEDQSQLTVHCASEAQRFIRASKSGPFFLYVPFSMPHLPVSAPEDMRGRSRNGLYGDTIETLDWAVGEILRALKEEGVDDNTLVVFTSDNGPWHNLPPRMLAEGVEPWHTGTKGVFRGAKGTSYEGGLRVPGIFRWPGTVLAGQVNMDMASTLDLFPTIVKAAGAEMPADRIYDGYDLMPVLRDGAKSPREVFYYHLGNMLEAVREGPWKYRYARNRTEAGVSKEPPVPELFHLDWDPAEQYNVYDRHRDIGDRLAAMLKEKAVELGARWHGPQAP